MKANHSVRFTVPWVDVDMMGHVNNARYLTYFETVRTEHLYHLSGRTDRESIGIILAHAEVDYKSQAKWQDELVVKIRTASVGNSSWTYEYEVANEKEDRIVATGKTVQVAFDYKLGRPVPLTEEIRKGLIEEMEETR